MDWVMMGEREEVFCDGDFGLLARSWRGLIG